jgi:two-component system CheB/CheR fusion protein
LEIPYQRVRDYQCQTARVKIAYFWHMGAQNEGQQFPVVGIGASAGGLEALESFFSKIPHESHMAFVVVQHLNPQHESMMDSLLSKHTSLTIKVIEEGMAIEPDVVYLNPPDRNIALFNGQFRLSEVNDANKGFFRIDHFFRSLATDQGQNAVCIVLSGTGSDGTMGLREVKSAGGLTMVQEEEQAGYGGMPHSAISTGMVDVVLSTEQMADELIQYVRHPYMENSRQVDVNLQAQQDTLQQLFNILRKHTGHDFSDYKLNTIYRRIERRMAVHQIEDMAEYLRYLQQHKAEVDTLFKDMLITVTSFFRDQEAFEALKSKVLPDLLANLAEDVPLRVWIPGCATGEEAYSIAILLIEAMEENNQLVDCKIFASDIDTGSIEWGRAGVYPESIKADVSEERLERFFTLEENQYRVKKRLRDMVVFAEQDLIKDPPFSNVDLVSCRNVLIYMNQEMHKRLFPVFHYALKNNGFLFLGSSESIGEFESRFKPIDNKYNIYRKKQGAINKAFDYPEFPRPRTRQVAHTQVQQTTSGQSEIRELVERTILEKYSYPCVVVNENFDILYIYGDTENYLAMPKGKVSLNLINVARESLKSKLLTALREATKEQKSVNRKDMLIRHENDFYAFDLFVHPLSLSVDHQQVLLVAFREKNSAFSIEKAEEVYSTDAENDKRMMVMEQELQSTRESLQATIEQLETSNEELQSKNEEMQATNEELQSSIEELETSKEEAQSTNEELISVNSELKQKINDLAEANNDINNLLASTEIATIFLDNDLRIKRFTPAMSTIFNLIQSDIGRSISDITSNINYQNIHTDARHVLETLEKQEKEIRTESGSWYAVRIIPYRTTENMIDGVVITFVEITENKLLNEASRLAAVVRDSNDAITVLDLNGDITAWNHSAEAMYGYSEAEALQMNISDLLPTDRKQEVKDLIGLVQAGKPVQSYQTKRLSQSGEEVNIWLTVTALVDNMGQSYALATTERKLDNRP